LSPEHDNCIFLEGIFLPCLRFDWQMSSGELCDSWFPGSVRQGGSSACSLCCFISPLFAAWQAILWLLLILLLSQERLTPFPMSRELRHRLCPQAALSQAQRIACHVPLVGCRCEFVLPLAEIAENRQETSAPEMNDPQEEYPLRFAPLASIAS
jgi:hypothetical protein